MSFDGMDVGKKGYCLVPDHPVEHVLTLQCWRELRNYFYNTSDKDSTFAAYKQKCERKKK
jgi:hypothetical protein